MADILEQLSRLTLVEQRKTKTGLIFDDCMKEHFCTWDPNHIERPERYIFSLERCRSYGLLERCEILSPRSASKDEILSLHDPGYFDKICKSETISDVTEQESFSSAYDAVYFNEKTYKCAMLAAGSTLKLVDSILSGVLHNGMAIIRPPGHHAMFDEACGFCVFNNVALAAKHALDKHDLKRILIVDWDVHHGQATQQMFYDDPRVLYFSIHRYEHGLFWPNLRESHFDFIGEGKGKGFNINVPLNRTGLGNTEYLAIFNNILLPVAFEFDPELVLVSAGYDAALGCPEGEMEVTPHAYSHMVNLLTGLAKSKLCVVLEGGYCLPSLSESVALSLRALLGDPCPTIFPTDIVDDSVVEMILNLITILKGYWKSLRIQKEYIPTEEKIVGVAAHVLKFKFLGPENISKPLSYPTRDGYPVQEPVVKLAIEANLEKLIGKTDLTVPKNCTCFVYNSKMTQHINKKDKGHPECSERITCIYEKLKNDGMLQDCFLLETRDATEEELGLVHDGEYINKIKSTASMKYRDISKLQDSYDSVYICQDTYKCSTIACGGVLQAVDAICTRNCTNGFALIRPPGHHAEIDEASGFCLFNHIAIAAKYAMKKYFMQKILILDWDIHHGNGTQHIFYDDNHVLYISLHRYDNGDFFPSSKDGNFTSCGNDAGAGFNINIPWNRVAKDGDYLAAFLHVVLPVAYEFCPELILISCGFDAVVNDPLGEYMVTPSFFGSMTRLLSGLANGKILLSLEGGYNLNQISESALHCVTALLGHPSPALPSDLYPSPEASETIRNVVKVHQKYWKCLQFGTLVPVYTEEYITSTVADHSKISTPVAIPTRDESNTLVMVVDMPLVENIPTLPTGGPDMNPEIDIPQFYCVTPLQSCPHLDLLQSLPLEGLNVNAPCQVCGDALENWVCLHCYQVYCGRFVNEHMLAHGLNMQHYLTLGFRDLSVWCYACDSYIENEVLSPIRQHVHLKKFGMHFG